MKYFQKYWWAIILIFLISAFLKLILCFLLLGSIFIYLSIESMLFAKKMHSGGIVTEGTIMCFEIDGEGDKTPIVEFTSNDGFFVKEKPFIYTSTDLDSMKDYKAMIGRKTIVIYDPSNPKKFVIEKEKDFSYGILIFCTIIGFMCVIVSISGLLGYIKIEH